jgi:Fe-S-cluster-containing dehydrogenase component
MAALQEHALRAVQMARYGMVIDVGRCVGCYSCFLACRDEHAGNDHLPVAIAQPQAGQKWIDVREDERGSFPRIRLSHIPVPCLHCAEAPCIAAGGGAVYRRDDGIVLLDTEKSVGKREIVSACPHGVIFWNEARNIPQKCTFCAHLLDDGWKEPRCVEVCPTQAIVFGDLDDSASVVATLHAAERTEELHPEYGLKPAVRYIGLPQRFVAGEVVLGDKTEVPAEGVRASLSGGGEVLVTTTDNYGDFIFAGLEDEVQYTLRIEHSGYRPHQQALRTRNDLNVGTIELDFLGQAENT